MDAGWMQVDVGDIASKSIKSNHLKLYLAGMCWNVLRCSAISFQGRGEVLVQTGDCQTNTHL
jgi:hypothetical protein